MERGSLSLSLFLGVGGRVDWPLGNFPGVEEALGTQVDDGTGP